MTLPSIHDDDLADWIRTQADATPDRYLFGLAGAPGSGKSTLSARLADVLDAVVVPMDGFHLRNDVLDSRGIRSVKGAPHTFDSSGFLETVDAIRRGQSDVSLPDFDRDTDEPRPNAITVPATAPIVIVEGNYLLLETDPWGKLRDLFDAIALLDIDSDLRVQRLIDRHVRFGKTPTEAASFVHASDEPNARLVEASRHRAHLIVRHAPVVNEGRAGA